MTRKLFRLLAAAAALTLSAPALVQAAWTQYRGNAGHTGLAAAPIPWTPRVAWRHDLGANVMIDATPVVAPDGTIYVGTDDPFRALVAIRKDGTEKWHINLWGYQVRATPAIRSDGSLVVVGYRYEGGNPAKGKGMVFLIGPAGNILAFSEEYGGAGTASPVLDKDDNAYYWYLPPVANDVLVRFDTSFLHWVVGHTTYNVESATSWWQFMQFNAGDVTGDSRYYSAPLRPSPSLDQYTATLIAPSFVTLRVTADGEKIWQKDIFATTTPALGAGVAYIATASKHVEKWNNRNEKEWQASLEGHPMGALALGVGVRDAADASTSMVSDVYVTADDGYLYAIDYKGRLRWRRQIGSGGYVPVDTVSESVLVPAPGSPVVIRDPVSTEQIVVVGSDWNWAYLRAYRRDGTLLWLLPLDSPALGSPAVSDGRIYAATHSSIYAIEDINAPKPMVQR